MEFNWLGMNVAAHQAANAIFGFLGGEHKKAIPNPAGIVLDIETTGLTTGLPVVEAAVYNKEKGVVQRWAIEPHYAGKKVTAEQVLAQAEPWFRERHKAMFSWVGKDATQVAPGEFVRQLAPHLQGQTVWVQNAPFESRMLGAFLKANVPESEALDLKSMFETSPHALKHRFNLFYVTGQRMQGLRADAYRTGDWMPVFEEMVRELNVPARGTRVRDIQDVTRAVFSESQRIGIMKELNSFTGSNMNVLSLAYGFGAEKHRAAADAKLEGKVLDRMWRTATGLHNARKGGFLGELGLLFDQSYREDLTVLKRVDSVRDMLKTKALFRSLAEARLAIEFTKNPEYAITEKFDTFTARMDTYQGNVVEQRISFPRKKVPADFDEAVRMLTSDHIHGKGLTTSVGSAVTAVKMASKSQLQQMVHVPFSLENDINTVLARTMDKAGRFTSWDAARVLFSKHPFKTAGLALTGLTLALGTLEVATARTSPEATQGDSYVDWSGLEPYGVGADMRRYSTDFGSGWKGLLNAMPKLELSTSRQMSRWFTEADAVLADLNVEGRAWRAMKKNEAGDYAQATSFMRQRNAKRGRCQVAHV
jgi:DNA polymerase III epsilon subunit-like protein